MSGRTSLLEQVVFLAPGLTLLRPPRNAGRTFTAVNSKNKVVLTLKRATAKTLHAAPKVAALTSTLTVAAATTLSQYHGVMSSAAELTFAEAPAEDVLAIVVYSLATKDPQGIAYWQRNKSELVYSYTTGGKGCVPGPGPVRQGDTIAIGFVDIHGRISPLSKPLVVGAPKTK